MDDKIATVSVASVEVLVSHYVRIIKWLVLALVLSLVLLFGSFAVPYFFGSDGVDCRNARNQRGSGWLRH